MRRFAGVLLLPLAMLACSEPPQREYHQAQGAIEAARAAGAEQYAAEDLARAEQALKQYDAAVAERDYRAALNHALDSRERASGAAKKAAAEKATRRGEIERAIATLAAEAERGRMAANSATRAQDAAARNLRRVITDTDRALQNSRAALERDDLRQAPATLDGLEARLAQALAPFRTPEPAPSARRR
jgi:hypothetical protein